MIETRTTKWIELIGESHDTITVGTTWMFGVESGVPDNSSMGKINQLRHKINNLFGRFFELIVLIL